jgi:hypothetical protein
MITIAKLKWIGIGILVVISVALAVWNRIMIKKEAAAA